MEIIRQLWPLLLLTGFFQALYFFGLAYAYKRGTFGCLPLARSLPALMVTMLVFLFGQGESIGGAVLSEIGLIIVGGFLIPLQSFRDFLAARGIKALPLSRPWWLRQGLRYSLTDDFALDIIRGVGPVTLRENFLIAFYYIGLQGADHHLLAGTGCIAQLAGTPNFPAADRPSRILHYQRGRNSINLRTGTHQYGLCDQYQLCCSFRQLQYTHRPDIRNSLFKRNHLRSQNYNGGSALCRSRPRWARIE